MGNGNTFDEFPVLCHHGNVPLGDNGVHLREAGQHVSSTCVITRGRIRVQVFFRLSAEFATLSFFFFL